MFDQIDINKDHNDINSQLLVAAAFGTGMFSFVANVRKTMISSVPGGYNGRSFLVAAAVGAGMTIVEHFRKKFVYNIILPGRTITGEDYPAEGTYKQFVYFVPAKSSDPVVASQGPSKLKPISCPVYVRLAETNPKNMRKKYLPQPKPYVIIYFHGNQECLEDGVDTIEKIHRRLNCTVVSMEYPGYGVTNEHFKETRPQDIDKWADDLLCWVTKDLKIPADYIVPYGWSIGTGPAAKFAENMWTKHHKAAPGLILNSPYRSIKELFRSYAGGLGALVAGNDVWDTQKAIGQLSAITKLLIIHGEKDTVVPFKQGEYLLNLYKELGRSATSDFHSWADHNDLWVEDYIKPIHKFIRDFANSPNDAELDVNEFIKRTESLLKNYHATPIEYRNYQNKLHNKYFWDETHYY